MVGRRGETEVGGVVGARLARVLLIHGRVLNGALASTKALRSKSCCRRASFKDVTSDEGRRGGQGAAAVCSPRGSWGGGMGLVGLTQCDRLSG